MNSICNSLLKHLLQILLRVHLLELFKLTIAHDSLTDIESVHVTAIAAVSEAEVEVVAVQAEPVTDTLCESFLVSLTTRLDQLNSIRHFRLIHLTLALILGV